MEDPKASFDAKTNKIFGWNWGQVWCQEIYTSCKSKAVHRKGDETDLKHEQELWNHMGTVESGATVSFEEK